MAFASREASPVEPLEYTASSSLTDANGNARSCDICNDLAPGIAGDDGDMKPYDSNFDQLHKSGIRGCAGCHLLEEGVLLSLPHVREFWSRLEEGQRSRVKVSWMSPSPMKPFEVTVQNPRISTDNPCLEFHRSLGR